MPNYYFIISYMLNMLNKIFLIKLFHTLIFFFMVTCLIYVFYSGIIRTFNWVLLIALIAIGIEGLALLLNRGRCPLTTLAEKHGAEKGSITDIFLPDLISRNVFRISIVLFSVALFLLAFRYFTGL